MSWVDNILGGIGKPKFLFIEDENLCLNPSFENEDLSDWVISSTYYNASRVADGNLISGDYCLKITPKSPTYTTIRQVISTGEALSGKTFLITFMARIEEEISRRTSFYIRSEDGVNITYYNKYLGPEWETFSIIHEFPPGVTHSNFRFGFDPFPNETRLDIAFRLDDVKVYEVNKQYIMPQPQYWVQNFEKSVRNRNELVDGTYKEYIRGWRYQIILTYEFLTPVQEEIRQEISEGEALIVFPHEDSEFCQKMIWDGDFERKYFKDKFLGHEGIISMIGVELINKKPSDLVGVGGYAIDDVYGIS